MSPGERRVRLTALAAASSKAANRLSACSRSRYFSGPASTGHIVTLKTVVAEVLKSNER
jgi:hypothetical protein